MNVACVWPARSITVATSCNNVARCCVEMLRAFGQAFRKDRGNQRTGGGVALTYRDEWKIKRLEFENDFECLWSEVFTTNSKYFIALLYHPLDPVCGF